VLLVIGLFFLECWFECTSICNHHFNKSFCIVAKIEGKLAPTLTLNHVTFAILAVSRVKTIGVEVSTIISRVI
jgi:hypothetical protein